MSCSNCPKVSCKSYPDSHCITYTGSSLPCTGIATNDRLDQILKKIDDRICLIAPLEESDPVFTSSFVSGITSLGSGLSLSGGVLSVTGSTYTNEMAQDAVGSILTNSSSISWNYNDGANTISASIIGYQPTNWNTAYSKRITGFALQSGSGSTPKTLRITLADSSFFDASFDDQFTASAAYNITNTDITHWNTAYNKYPTAIAFSGVGTKTLTVTLNDGSTLSSSFADIIGAGSGGGIPNAYYSFTDGTNSSSASGADTFKLRTANNLLSILVGNNDSTHGDSALFTINTTTLTSFIQDTVKKIEVRFRVGDTGALAAAGATSFTLKDCSGNPLTGRKISLYIEGYRKFDPDHYTYDPVTALVTLTTALLDKQLVIVETEPQGLWTECVVGTAASNSDYPYTLPMGF